MSSAGGPSDGLSTTSTESMVAITRTETEEERKARTPHLDQLLWSKSKVYVHPTAYARDNVPGFVALTKRDGLNPTYLLAWIPETLLDEKGQDEWEKFTKVEAKPADDDDDIVLVDLPSRGQSYAFSVPLTSVYSLVVNPPSLSSWYGSVGVNLINGSNLPTLHFHDDESRSINQGQASYSWGGEDLLQRLRQYSNILRSSLQPTLFLVDPSRQDIETHSTLLFNDDSIDSILSPTSPVPPHRRPRPQSVSIPSGAPQQEHASGHSRRNSILHQTFAPLAPPSPGSQARSALMAGFSNITRATRHAAQNILSHPLAKPILPHLPEPVKSLVNAQGEWSSWVEKGGVGEFESARIYLARWARIVAEEGERSRRLEAQAVPVSASASSLEETSDLGVFELLRSTMHSSQPPPKPSRDPAHPVDRRAWEKFFRKDGSGLPRVSWAEFRHEVFRRGLTPGLRKTAWPFLLGVVPWDVDAAARDRLWEEKKAEYARLKATWCGVEEVFNREDILEERHRIDVDCRRTDRTQPLFASPPQGGMASSFSPNIQDIGAQPPSNEHVEALAGILLTYNMYETQLGYVQGMSDLCAPIYVATGADEALTFWCFVEVMNRMKPNFARDQSGMKKQLLTLQQLIAVMDPEIYRHLEKIDGLNLFFCFRWVLIAFKREFGFDDVLRLWEVLWTDYYTNQFVLFVALAVIESHRDVILRYLVEFDEILKYCNELSGTIELDSTLAQAEVLFLSFAQLVADIDRRAGERDHTRSKLRRRKSTAGDGTVVSTPATPLEIEALDRMQLPTISENLRELLKSGRENEA